MTPTAQRPGRRPSLAARRTALAWLRGAAAGWLADAGAGLPRLPSEGPQLDTLARLAELHALEPLLHRMASRPGAGTAPPELARRWERAYFQCYARACGQLDLVVELAAEARREGAPVRVLKGLATCARVYADPGLRPSGDVDLLCRRDDLAVLCRLAAARGFRRGARDAPYHLGLVEPASGDRLELHFDVYDVFRDRERFLETAWGEAAAVELDGRALPALAAAPHAAFTLAHLLKHDFRLDLLRFLDLAALLAAPDGDGEALTALLAEQDLLPELELVRGLLARLFVAGAAEGAHAEAAALAAAVEGFGVEIDRQIARPRFAQLAALPWRRRPAYLWRLLFPPRRELAALAELDAAPPAAAGRPGHLAAAWRRARRRAAPISAVLAGPRRRLLARRR